MIVYLQMLETSEEQVRFEEVSVRDKYWCA